MAVNKVMYGNQVVIDISDSTVSPSTLLAGIKAYGADGQAVNGQMHYAYLITLREDQYAALSAAEKNDDDYWFYIPEANPTVENVRKNIDSLLSSPASSTGSLTLLHDISDYDEIQILFDYGNGGTYTTHNIVVSQLIQFKHADYVDYATPHWMVDALASTYARITYDEDNDSLYVEENSGVIRFIFGIKYGGSTVSFADALIDDTHTATYTTWSSNKIASEIANAGSGASESRVKTLLGFDHASIVGVYEGENSWVSYYELRLYMDAEEYEGYYSVRLDNHRTNVLD